ncbi:hypothetical protein [Coxiella-like endosymbiont]|uniref:hypothetical protein n=1 Tax=Coxiella-like endosymbiont TaxID=1592897 RepID=UPI00272A3C0C|nr:hypothetical protein [Coxiella-like endosymbiont]
MNLFYQRINNEFSKKNRLTRKWIYFISSIGLEIPVSKNTKFKDTKFMEDLLLLIDFIANINVAIRKVDLTAYLSQYKFDSLVIAEIILRINKKI